MVMSLLPPYYEWIAKFCRFEVMWCEALESNNPTIKVLTIIMEIICLDLIETSWRSRTIGFGIVTYMIPQLVLHSWLLGWGAIGLWVVVPVAVTSLIEISVVCFRLIRVLELMPQWVPFVVVRITIKWLVVQYPLIIWCNGIEIFFPFHILLKINFMINQHAILCILD